MKIARGVIAFEYIVEDDPYAEGLEGEELVNYFTDTMVDDVIDMKFRDIKPAIEMEIIEAKPIGDL
jgi:hypothetical protein